MVCVGYVAYLSYSLRNQPSEFQESKWLGLIGMNVASVGSVVGAVYFWMANQLNYSSLVLLQSVGTFVVCTIAVVCLMGPKMLRIMKGDAKVQARTSQPEHTVKQTLSHHYAAASADQPSANEVSTAGAGGSGQSDEVSTSVYSSGVKGNGVAEKEVVGTSSTGTSAEGE